MTGTVPQSLRGIPGGFGQQQPQQQQSGRGVASRLPNGKMGKNITLTTYHAELGWNLTIYAAPPVSAAAGWTFGGSVQMGGSTSGPPGSARQLGGNVSFAQSLSGSQPATPLDPSYVHRPPPLIAPAVA